MAALRVDDRPAPVAPTRVLVVEDEVLIRLMLADSLREAGCEVVEAASGDEALSVLHAAAAMDVMITDVRMPGRTDGLALASQMRSRQPEMKIIVTSGHACCDASLVDGFLPKPYGLADIVERVRRLAGRDA
ncbi:MAG TPA: response regulator [Caulobacteraceae bacterium]|jgi:CheY-like chemotaxis protein|nr:response regulator [Caulobacteraceae bacterium]